MTQETFERELARRADQVHGAPFTFEDVRGRARRIRRRRAAGAAAGVAAAVAAIAVVPGLVAGGSHRSAPEPAPAPAVARTGVLHDGVLTRTDGGTVRLPLDNADVTDVGLLADGRVVVSMQRPQAIRVYEPDGTLQAAYRPSYNVFTMSASGDAVAWVARDLSVQVLASGADTPTTLPGIPMPGEGAGTISAVIDAEHLLVGDGPSTQGELTPDGYTGLTTPEQLRVDDVSPRGDLWSVDFPPGPDQQVGCSGLYDPATSTVVARACDVGVLRFSPDGRHLLASSGENNMMVGPATYDLELRRLGDLAPADPSVAVSRVAWADAQHVLVVSAALDSATWTVERVSLDGSDRERVAGPTQGRNPEQLVEYLPTE